MKLSYNIQLTILKNLSAMRVSFNIPGEAGTVLKNISYFNFVSIFVLQYSGDAMTADTKRYTKDTSTMPNGAESRLAFFISILPDNWPRLAYFMYILLFIYFLTRKTKAK